MTMDEQLKKLGELRLREQIRFCKKCGAVYKYKYGGMYECPNCGNQIFDDFGLIKDYIDKHGISTSYVISQATGVTMETITKLLRQGRLEIPEGSAFYIKCEKCGVDIRYGKYCPECATRLANSLRKAFVMECVGERPKTIREGKMRYLEKEKIEEIQHSRKRSKDTELTSKKIQD